MSLKKKRRPHNLIILSAFQEKFIRDNFYKMTNREIAVSLGLNLTTMRKHAYRMGLKRMVLEYWCDTSIRFLRLYYRRVGDTELAELFEKHFPKVKRWTKKHIDKKRRYLGLLRTSEEILEVKKRNVRKGRFALCPVKAWATRGMAAEFEVRIQQRDGIKFAVVKLNGQFTPRNRWLWESTFGPLAANEIVRAKPGAPLICTVNDLEIISMAENAWRNHLVGSAIAKRKFKIIDTVAARKFAEENPQLIEVHQNIIKINKKINERRRKDQ